MPEIKVEETDEQFPRINIACGLISFESNKHEKPYGNNSIIEGKLFEAIKRFLAGGFKELPLREKKKKKKILRDELEEDVVKKKKKKKKKVIVHEAAMQDEFEAIRKEERIKAKKLQARVDSKPTNKKPGKKSIDNDER